MKNPYDQVFLYVRCFARHLRVHRLPSLQAMWYVKCRALTMKTWLDDTEMEVAPWLSAVAAVPAPRLCTHTPAAPFLRQPSIVAVRFQQLPPTWCCATGRRRRRAAPRQQLHFAAAARGHLAFKVSGRMPRALRRNLALSASRSLRTYRSGAAPIAKPEVKPSPRSPHAVRAQASHADGQLDTVARDSAGLRVWPAPHRLCETRHRWPAPRLGRHRRERFPG